MNCKIYIGTAGWYYPDWREIVYSADAVKRKKELDILSEWFNCCEINSSFYAIPTPQKVKVWLDKLHGKKDFIYNVKLWQGFTHKREYKPEEAEAFRKILGMLQEKKRLGCVLAQFPYSFKQKNDNLEYLEKLINEFKDFPISIEVRHTSWLGDNYLNLLKSHNVCFCNIDQPDFQGNIPSTSYTTSDFGYVRFHGRRKDVWFADNEGNASVRYDYLYSQDEISRWIKVIQKMMKHLEKIFVITNNHYRGKAVANAMQIKNQLEGTRFKMTNGLLREYPDLNQISSGLKEDTEELRLF